MGLIRQKEQIRALLIYYNRREIYVFSWKNAGADTKIKNRKKLYILEKYIWWYSVIIFFFINEKQRAWMKLWKHLLIFNQWST